MCNGSRSENIPWKQFLLLIFVLIFVTVRKENEALMNSLNHDSSVQENSTTSP